MFSSFIKCIYYYFYLFVSKFLCVNILYLELKGGYCWTSSSSQFCGIDYKFTTCHDKIYAENTHYESTKEEGFNRDDFHLGHEV